MYTVAGFPKAPNDRVIVIVIHGEEKAIFRIMLRVRTRFKIGRDKVIVFVKIGGQN